MELSWNGVLFLLVVLAFVKALFPNIPEDDEDIWKDGR